MRKASRRLGSVRIALIAWLGLMEVALSACDDASASTGTPAAEQNSQAVTGSTSTPTSGAVATTPTATTTPAPTTGGATLPSQAVTLAWEAPTLNSDGTPLTDLVGYNIHYGLSSQDYTGTVAVNNPTLTRYVVESLPAGKYYFAVAATNSKGVESGLSQEVSASLN
jgi:hypothetical protein